MGATACTRILVVEDEAGSADDLRHRLAAEGHRVDIDADCSRALTADPDLVILDRSRPDLAGLEVLRRIRTARPALPVILLTARAAVTDRVRGLDAGATDYVVKPVAFDELAARVRAHLRAASVAAAAARLHAGGIAIDRLTREVTFHGHPVALSATEFELLAHLVGHADEVLSRAQLLESVWGYAHDPGTNIVEVYVGNLRRKLRTAGRPAPIDTVRSAGYRLHSG